MRILALIGVLCLATLGLRGQSQTEARERITNFDIQIEVHTDRSILVTEHIEVYAAGEAIRRGITRSLPKYRRLNNDTKTLHYKMLKVEKDGKEEPYFSNDGGNNIIYYIGREDVFLTPGLYRYMLQYEVPNQIGFAENYDEIYWNAIGTDVEFPVEKASCIVQLPPGARSIQEACYTGAEGSTASNCTKEIIDDGRTVRFQLTQPLRPYEGFTVGVGFPKGVVHPPSFLSRYGIFIILGLGLVGLLWYYISTWIKYGIDPPKPTPYPLFSSPDNLPPGALDYISREYYQTRCFTAAIIQLAIKGFLRIEEEEKKGFFSSSKMYSLRKLKDRYDGLPADEQSLMKALFAGGNDTITLGDEYNERLEKAYNAHKNKLRHLHHSFLRAGDNKRLLVLPALVSVGVFVLAMFLGTRSSNAPSWYILIAVAFFVTAIILLFIYNYLIKKPTIEKLKLQSEIEGFKMYLEMAEKDRLRLLNPPERTPEHFEAMLPFAFALGVEHKWSKLFKDVLEKAMYQPEWCNSPNVYLHSNQFSSSFSKSVDTAATPPSSSGSGVGGSGGGGFSGGGGGGGGVGGW